MISSRRRNITDLSAIAIGLLIGLILAALLLPMARAEAEIDAGTLDRAALIATVDAGPAVVAPPPVEPATVDEGLTLGRWVWAQFRAGRVAPALIVLLHLLGLVAIRRWTWVARRLPRLTRGRALAAVSSLTGSLAALTPLVATDAALAGPLYGAIAAAVGVYLLPGPTQIAGETVPA